MKREIYEKWAACARDYYRRAGIIIRDDEAVEIADLGFGHFEKTGLALVVYVNTQRVCAKEMVLIPHQTCPEHWHVDTNGQTGKEETFRCRYGTVYLYVDGEGKKEDVKAELPETQTSVYHEIILHPGDQYTIMPYTKHWFQAGDEGAVISEFSTRSTDETDQFTDPRLKRDVVIED